jgi:hypothetical protein
VPPERVAASAVRIEDSKPEHSIAESNSASAFVATDRGLDSGDIVGLVAADEHGGAGANGERKGEPLGPHVGHDDATRTDRTRNEHADETDRTGAQDQDGGAGANVGALARVHADTERLAHRTAVVRDLCRQLEAKVGRMQHGVAQRTVDGRRGEELHARAQVVHACATLRARATRHAGLQRDAIAHRHVASRHRRSLPPRRPTRARSPSGRATRKSPMRPCCQYSTSEPQMPTRAHAHQHLARRWR